MSIKDLLTTAFLNLWRRKMRAFLTVLGMVIGVASIRWVRPVLTTPPIALAWASMVLRRCSSCGSSAASVSRTAITRSAVGMVSLLLWPRFT